MENRNFLPFQSMDHLEADENLSALVKDEPIEIDDQEWINNNQNSPNQENSETENEEEIPDFDTTNETISQGNDNEEAESISQENNNVCAENNNQENYAENNLVKLEKSIEHEVVKKEDSDDEIPDF